MRRVDLDQQTRLRNLLRMKLTRSQARSLRLKISELLHGSIYAIVIRDDKKVHVLSNHRQNIQAIHLLNAGVKAFSDSGQVESTS